MGIKYDILKNVGNQTVEAIHFIGCKKMEVNGYRQQFGYQHSSKYCA